ncbi:hypothetical protein J3E71DRAFT_243335 [Bipolaris maydis]|nr:hypothetical protein J3E71DRAFT_243335 [Bipolaris maydis]
MQRDGSVTAVDWWRRKWEKRQWERWWWWKREACTSEGRREVRPEQESRSDMRHNASVRQMTMWATSSPNKLQPRAPALRRPWGVLVPVAPLTGGRVCVCHYGSRRGNTEETGCRWAGEQQEKKNGRKKSKSSHLDYWQAHLLAPAPWRAGRGLELHVLRGERAALDLDAGVAVLRQSQCCMIRYRDAAFGSSGSGQGGGMTLVWIFWRAASKTSQGVVVVVLLLWLAQSEQGFAVGRGQNGLCLVGCGLGGAADARVE